MVMFLCLLDEFDGGISFVGMSSAGDSDVWRCGGEKVRSHFLSK